MYKFIFTMLTDPLGLPISPLWEYLILVVLNEIAFHIAWDISPGGFGGSTIHWVVRLLTFALMWAVVYGVIAFVKWLCVNWLLVLAIIGVVALIGSVPFLLYRRHKAKTIHTE